MKAEEILSYLNRLEQEESTFRAVKREIGSVIPAYLEAQKGLAEIGKEKARLEEEIKSLATQRDGLQNSVRKAREEFAQIDIQRKTKRMEFASECATLDGDIAKKKEKLVALESAISDRAETLGRLIARELV